VSRVVKIQTNFSSGEIDPLLRSRIDLQQYYNALETADNVFCLPQGGVKRRDGLKFIHQLPGSASPQDGVRLLPFEFSAADSYMFCLTNGKIFVFRNAALVTDINGSGNDFITASSITGAMLSEIRFAQSADTMIIVHEDLKPQKLVRGTDHNRWTLSDISLTNPPKHAFTITTTNPNAQITPDASVETVTVTADANIFHDGATDTAQAGATNTITLHSGASSDNDIYNGSTIRITSGTGNGQKRVISDYVGSSKVATVSTNWTTQPDATSAFTIDSHVDQFINITDSFGRLRIVAVNSATEVRCFAEISLFDNSAVASGDYELELGYEDSFSDERGFPKSCTFHEGRLFFGGSKALPTTFFGSVVNNFFDFELGEGLDDQAVIASITTASLNEIVDIHAGRDLQIFTTAGEFYIAQGTLDPITPRTLAIKVGTRNGAKPGVPVVGLDSGTLYVQRLGKALNELVFTDVEISYTTSAVSLLSGHLLKTPIDMAIRRATSTEEADRLFLVNGDDGTISCFSLLRSQQVVAPSNLTTDGSFLAAGVDVDTVYTVVKRKIPAQATCTITVTDASAIVAGDTITFKDNAGTSYTLTATTDDPPTGETATSLKFSMGGGRTNNDVADNIAVGHGGTKGINSLAAFSAPNPASNVITVTRAVAGNNNLTVTSSRSSAISVTNFTGGETDVYYVEVFDSSIHTDSAVFSSSSASTGSASHLEHKTLDVIVDGNVQAQKTVSSGSVTFDRASNTNFEIGLPFQMTVKTLPVEPRLASGNLKGFKKRILEVNAEVFQSQAMNVNGQLVAFRQFGESVLDGSVSKFTGVKKISPLLGYTNEGTITVTQTVPLDLTILGLDYKVSVGQ